MQNNSKILKVFSQPPRWKIIAVTVVVLTTALYFVVSRGKTVNNGATFVARRGPLEITVLKGGSTEALESQDIKCEVRGYQGVKILKLVEEGYQVTEEDIKNGKVLVELDSSELQKQIAQQEILFQSSLASLTDARNAYDIQVNQNFSDVKAAEQKVKFGRMDFEKFMGDGTTEEILTQVVQMEAKAAAEARAEDEAKAAAEAKANAEAKAAAQTNEVKQLVAAAPAAASKSSGPAAGTVVVTATNGTPLLLAGGSDKIIVAEFIPPANQSPKPAPPAPPELSPSLLAPLQLPSIDFSRYAKVERLGDGEAKQKIRKLDDDLQAGQKELNLNKTLLDGTRRLFDKGFVTKTELEGDEIKHDNSKLKVQTAVTARDLFLRYEFIKSSEETLSKYLEAVRELDRARKGAVSKLAQAEAKLKSAEGQYNVQLRQRKELSEQIDKSVIRAKKSGLVVYGGRSRQHWYNQEQIREGALVREQQPILTIPDMTRMAVKVGIHETYIKKVKKGQKVRITVDAFPDKQLEGEVTKVGVLPDSQNEWMNPDMKLYLTTIDIKGVTDWLKPGMTAKVEILVNTLPDVVYVPIQAVIPIDGKQYIFVDKGLKQERREVEVGEYNDEFIEIKKGIKESEKVCLRAPEGTEKDEGGRKSDDSGKPVPPKPEPAKGPVKTATL